MVGYNDKQTIRKHYDVVSPYYQSLWGEHIHHGYWIRGDETKERAQLQLIEHLAQVAGIPPGCTILDSGCGFGSTAIYLAKKFGAKVTGITISPVQVEMANRAARQERADAKFLLMDAEEMKFDEKFDLIWSTESVAHYQDVPKFFASAARFLKPAMVELHTMREYEEWMRANGLNVAAQEILNAKCAKTWDVCLEIIKKKEFWGLAAKKGAEFVRFLRGFSAMRAGFASGNFVYGLLVAKKG